ncbi:MAG TPA: SigE family RNA polymerase sigma factor [Nocardioidaceae bacterium]|jgi:RNA polymerase sigma-70 factor (ECF subfamily)
MAEHDFVREVYDAAYPRLVAQMLVLCGDQGDAEDVVQEAFVKAMSQRSAFGRLDNPEAWLRTVALNLLRNRWRRSAVFRRLMPRLPGSQHQVELSPDRVAVIEALRKLDQPLREVVTLHHIGDLPVEEVARTLGIPSGTVKARLVRGRAVLAEHLAETTADREENHHV